MQKRYLVIGTSNSIVKGGWFDGFVSIADAKVERKALGGAPFTQFFSELQSLDLAQYDLVILECSPNDESYSDKVGFSWFFDTLYQGFIASIIQYSNLLILRVPALDCITSPSNTWKRQLKIASELNVAVYDMSDSLLNGNAASDIASLYRDKYHPKTELIHQAGVEFAKWLNGEKLDIYPAIQLKPAFGVYTQRINRNNKVSISNSLIDENFDVLGLNESFKFERPGFCIGFFVAAEHSWGFLKMYGLDDSIQYSFVYFDSNKNLGQKKFIPIKNGYYLKAISLSLPHKVIDCPLHSNVPLDGPNKVAFGDFVFLDNN